MTSRRPSAADIAVDHFKGSLRLERRHQMSCASHHHETEVLVASHEAQWLASFGAVVNAPQLLIAFVKGCFRRELELFDGQQISDVVAGRAVPNPVVHQDLVPVVEQRVDLGDNRLHEV